MHNFHSLEVVVRGRETQLQVGENLNKLTHQAKGKPFQRGDRVQTPDSDV